MKLRAFTLIELLVTTTIIVLMAVIAIPQFNKNQVLIELQNKSDEVKAGIDEMQVKALNAEKDKTRYYAKIYTTDKKVEYYNNVDASPYKTVNLTADQILARSTGISSDYLVCDKGKSYCCNTIAATTVCTEADKMTNTDFFTITNGSKTTTFKIFANPFRVTTTMTTN